MNEEIQCTTNKGKRKNVYQWMEKDDSDLLQVLYSVHKKLESYFSILVNFFEQRFISSAKSYNCLNKFTS